MGTETCSSLATLNRVTARIARALAFGLVLLAAPIAATAQPASKVQRVGFLVGSSSAGSQANADAFRQGLRELGWVEGRNIVVEYRFADGRYDRLPELAADLVRLKVDVIAAGGNAAAAAARNTTQTIPIVMMSVGDPVGLGLVASLARPGGNVTGLAFSVGLETFDKSLELLKETIPNARHVAVLANPNNPSRSLVMERVNAAARSLGLQLHLLEARGPDEFDRAFATMTRQRVAAVFVVSEALFLLHRARLAELEARHRLPSMHAFRENVEAGALMSYGPSLKAIWRRGSFFVDRILKGAQAGDLPVEQPSTFELVINTKRATTLGLTIPPSLLLRADEIIE
jgi:putative tryptophan/tyrosine transport system substrate-binding protein